VAHLDAPTLPQRREHDSERGAIAIEYDPCNDLVDAEPMPTCYVQLHAVGQFLITKAVLAHQLRHTASAHGPPSGSAGPRPVPRASSVAIREPDS
jgi:hypothetical protein